jgi:hypothetical protein
VTKGWVGFGTWLARTGIITLSRTGPFREKVTNWAAELLLNSLYTEQKRLYLVWGTRQTLCAAAYAGEVIQGLTSLGSMRALERSDDEVRQGIVARDVRKKVPAG